MGNIRKYRDIKLVTRERRKNYLVSEPNYHSTKFFTENLLATAFSRNLLKKAQMLMNKPVYLGISVLDLSKIVIYELLM